MNNRILLKYHSYLGLVSGLFLLIIGLTGAILAFSEDIDEAIFEKYQVVSTEGNLTMDEAIKTVQSHFPGWEARIIHFTTGESILFNLRLPDARRFVFVHPSTGQIIANIDANTTLTKWLLQLHYSFHAGTFGRILVLIMGIMYLLSIITGILLYRKVIVKTLLFKVKLNRKKRAQFNSGIHRYVGVWALLFNLILVVTGIFLAYKVAKAGLQEPKAPSPPKINISLDQTLAQLKIDHPDFNPTYIRLPKNESAPITVNGIFKNDPFYLSEYFNKILVDNETGKVTTVTKVSEAGLLTQLDSMISPLHFGQFGGLPIKILYCLIGLSGPLLSVTGFIVWQKKRRKKNRKLYN
ncbi:PepSY domain-containing protein [Euzebyella marina]|uniref:PepSY domain-containing protein n=1 Tax=Euzebyella marina TaxID=1761453 RepID=A0A3G2L7Y4_9FLAO|nr:PepSY-associated TM helix domain-containing protein [Euzebyella marina]AYN68370.1 PepSY domain-containing protein [Euzebyella marina]